MSRKEESVMPNALDTYLTAVRKFEECASASTENLVKAQEAYEGAIAASAEIREILNSQTEALGSTVAKLKETMTFSLLAKNNAKKTIDNTVTENLPQLLRQIEESDSNNGEHKDKLEAPKKRMWQL
jgi:hypothetical protein